MQIWIVLSRGFLLLRTMNTFKFVFFFCMSHKILIDSFGLFRSVTIRIVLHIQNVLNDILFDIHSHLDIEFI